MKHLIATRYEILRDVVVTSKKVAATLAERPARVALLLDEAAFTSTRRIEHWKTVFIDDRMHDWEWHEADGAFRYYSHAAGVDEVVDVVIIYELEYVDAVQPTTTGDI